MSIIYTSFYTTFFNGLMEQQDIKPSDLVGVIGSEELVSEVIIDKREISKSEAKALGKFFKVNPVLFIW
ncbi:hypothetical protein CAL7716_095790 [Calothrix sp. PCC 7716]|nr:hypothetical protein CAL7716_095790 [Calothrix sp. PCC 7716]